ncbi:hypothetical protein BGX21_004391, partial [Mortierella sp. AD011]
AAFKKLLGSYVQLTKYKSPSATRGEMEGLYRCWTSVGRYLRMFNKDTVVYQLAKSQKNSGIETVLALNGQPNS